MKFLCILLSIGQILSNVLGVIINCPSYSTCILANVSKDDAILENIRKVTFLSVTESSFDETFLKSLFFTEFDQLKTLKINNTTFTSINIFRSLVQSIIESQSYLKVLDLSHNKGVNAITKRTFSKIINETAIKTQECYLFTLDLSNNQLNDVESGAFTIFESLETLDLSYNRIQNLRESLTERPLFNLKVLKLNNNLLKEISEETFKGLYNLEKLFLNNNFVKALPAPNLKPLKNLRVLDVSTNHLQSLEILSPKLKTLNVAVNYLAIDRIRGLDRLTHLKSLNISYNPIGSITNETFRRLISLEELKMQSLTLLKLTYDDAFLPLINLKYFDIRNNQLTEIRNLALNKLTKLIMVQLDENRLSFINASDLPFSLRYVGLQGNLFQCEFLGKLLEHLRDNGVRLYFTNESSLFGLKFKVQGLQCLPKMENISGECSEDYLQLYFYTWHTKVSALVCLILAVTYVSILWKNKEAIRRFKDEEYEQEQLLEDEESFSGCSFNYDDLLEKEKSNELY